MSLVQLFFTFLRFGFLAWGGPVAQINMIREELVEEKQWIAKDKFKRVLAVYQALPGPEAHEICVYFGMVKAGRLGGLLAGLGFMLPGLVLMLGLSWGYTVFGSSILTWFVGIAPAVAALVVRAVHRIGGHVLLGWSLWVAGFVSVGLSFAGVHFFAVFIICALWQALWVEGYKKIAITTLIASVLLACSYHFYVTTGITSPIVTGMTRLPLFVEGLKAGLLSFGGAYTVIPFLKESLVGVYPHVTPQAFLDGIALSSVIPAPLVIFGTYLGFIANGLTGALAVTAGIFLPAFAVTLIGHNHLEKLVANPAWHGVLDGISAGVVGMLAVTAVDIVMHTITDMWRVGLFVAALAGLYVLKRKWAIPVVVVVCSIIGVVMQ